MSSTPFHNWQTTRLDPTVAPWNDDSPNLVALREHMLLQFGGVSLGIHYDRPVRAGRRWSSHAFGAALDWRWGWHPDFDEVEWLTREELDTQVIPWLIRYAKVLGVQAIHDQGRIWRSYRADDSSGGWKAYRTRYGPWLHIETSYVDWANDTPIQARGIPGHDDTPIDAGPPVGVMFDPREGDFGLWPLRQPPFGAWPPTCGRTRNEKGDHVRYLQGVILHRAGGDITVDGFFGPQTESRVKDLQTVFELTVDGWVGPQTWPAVHFLATIDF